MARRLTTKEFIEKAINLHGNKYDYSMTMYKNRRSNIKIICEEHGMYNQNSGVHLSGSGCPKCGLLTISKKRRLSTEEFIERANKKHGNKYDYSKVDYKTAHDKIIIICRLHGEFLQKPSDHLNGCGCNYCRSEIIGNLRRSNTIEFIIKANKLHNNYDYSLVKYKHSDTPVNIICKKHGVFKQTPHRHLMGSGCPKCANKNVTTEEFINKAKKSHGNYYDYSLVNYEHSKLKVIIKCPKHGNFKQIPNAHLIGQGCPFCYESKGEKKIRDYLQEKNIIFERQKRFDNCKNIVTLPFDFYLPRHNLLIEYDGEQHFKVNKFFGGNVSFNALKKNDTIKNEFVKNEAIKLIRIPFYEYNNIEKILNKKIL